jgi:hypothetical protein
MNNIAKLFLIAKRKNDPKDCILAELPVEILKEVFLFYKPVVVYDIIDEFIDDNKRICYDRQIVSKFRENFFIFEYYELFKKKKFYCYFEFFPDRYEVTKDTLPIELSKMLIEGIVTFFEGYYKDKGEKMPTEYVYRI